MRIATIGILALLLLTPAVAASHNGTPGPFVGAVQEDDTQTHRFNSHPHSNCLAIHIPHLYVVTLTTAPTDALRLAVPGQTAVSENGVATVTFTANYCTAFDVSVTGLDVEAGKAAYAVTVESVFTGGAVVDPGTLASASAPCTLMPDPFDCVDYADRRGEDLTSPFICEREDMLPGIRQC